MHTILGRVNVKLPTFNGSASEDTNDHVSRFLAICKSRGLEREDAYLALFPSTLEGYADQWFGQLAVANLFPTWGDLRDSFYTTFRPSDYQERVLHELHNLTLCFGEMVAELMTKPQVLVAKLSAHSSYFMVKQ